MFPDGREHPQHRRPLWLAALVTTVAAPLSIALILYVVDVITNADLVPRSEGFFRGTTATFFVGLPISAISMYLLGLPMILLLRKRQWLTAPTVCLAAVIAGGVGFISVAILMFSNGPDLEGFALGAGMGLLAGIVFSLVAGVSLRRVGGVTPA